MSVGIPPGTPPYSPFGSPRRARAQNASPGSDPIQLQHDANARASEIQGEIDSINQEGQQNINQLKEDYDQQYVAEGTREEAAIASEKLKGYERLREIQRQNRAEQQKAQRHGEEDLAQIQDRFRTSISQSTTSTDQALKDQEIKSHEQLETERAQAAFAVDSLKKDDQLRQNALQEGNHERLEHLGEQYRKVYEERRASAETETERSLGALEASQSRIVADHRNAENRVGRESNRQLASLRADTARKLAAYQERQADPFYKLQTLDADFREEGDRYVLTAKIPEFEQSGVKVIVSGNQLILSGTRRNEEKLELEPGHSRSTSSYQAYSESFPLFYPVDAKRLTRESDGDWLRITLPKKPATFVREPAPVREVRRATLERPRFPANLPHVPHHSEDLTSASRDETPPASESMPGPQKRDQGSGTLT